MSSMSEQNYCHASPYFFDFRFLPEEKSKRDPLHFMPFSDGPRHCVGKRLALMEMKMSMVHVLKKFKFVKCSETEVGVIVQ